ncbi:hypothetical protein [Prevotella micans]|nr:hypothetical protein [Prevotella micans]
MSLHAGGTPELARAKPEVEWGNKSLARIRKHIETTLREFRKQETK